MLIEMTRFVPLGLKSALLLWLSTGLAPSLPPNWLFRSLSRRSLAKKSRKIFCCAYSLYTVYVPEMMSLPLIRRVPHHA